MARATYKGEFNLAYGSRGLESMMVEQRHVGRQLEKQWRAYILIHNEESKRVPGMALVYEILRPAPNDIPTPRPHLLILPKQFYQLGLNIQT